MSFEGKNLYEQYIDYSEKKAKGFICPYTGTIFYNIRIYSRSQVSVYRTIGPLVKENETFVWVGSFEIVMSINKKPRLKCTLCLKGKLLDIAYCTCFVFQKSVHLAKLESYYYTKIKHHSLYMRVTVVLCNHNYPCTFVSPRFLSQVYWSMNTF